MVPRLVQGHSMNFTIPWRLLGSRIYLLYRVLEKVKFDQLPGVILSRVLLGALSSIGHCFFCVCASKRSYSIVPQSFFWISNISKLCASLNCSSWTEKHGGTVGVTVDRRGLPLIPVCTRKLIVQMDLGVDWIFDHSLKRGSRGWWWI